LASRLTYPPLCDVGGGESGGRGNFGGLGLQPEKSVDYHSRRAKRIDQAPIALLEEVLAILDACSY